MRLIENCRRSSYLNKLLTTQTDICLEIDKIYYAESRWHVKHSVKQSPKVRLCMGVGLISQESHTLVSTLFLERAEPKKAGKVPHKTSTPSDHNITTVVLLGSSFCSTSDRSHRGFIDYIQEWHQHILFPDVKGRNTMQDLQKTTLVTT